MGVPYRKLTPLECGFEPGSAALDQQLMQLEALEELRPAEEAKAYVERVTLSKFKAALELSLLLTGFDALAPVLCADTTVCLNSKILGKPQSSEEALQMMESLSGNTHEVLTSVVLGTSTGYEQRLSHSRVEFAALTQEEMLAHVRSGEWKGKAGGYAIQGRAACFITAIHGSYSGIMGLPIYETAQLLKVYGLMREPTIMPASA
jgi:septum formation protein